MTPFSTKCIIFYHYYLFIYFCSLFTWQESFGGLKMQTFKNRFRCSNNNISVSVYKTKTQICENSDVIRLCITHAVYRNVYVHSYSVSHKLRAPTSGLAWIMQSFLMDQQGLFWQLCCLYVKLFKDAEQIFCRLVHRLTYPTNLFQQLVNLWPCFN